MLDAEMRTTGQKIQARLVEGEKVVSEQDVQLTRVAAGDLLCGVLSRSGPSFDFLPTLELPPPLAAGAHLPHRGRGPADPPQVLASLDCIIFDNIATSIDAGQPARRPGRPGSTAAGCWSRSAGRPGRRRSARCRPTCCPVKANGLSAWIVWISLADLGGEPIKDTGPWLVSQAALADGNLVADQDGVPLIAAVRRGSGTVLYLAMDPTAEPLRSWAGTPASGATCWRTAPAESA